MQTSEGEAGEPSGVEANSEELRKTAPPDGFVWTCAVCAKPIRDGMGHLTVDGDRAQVLHTWWIDGTLRTSLDAEANPKVPWVAVHSKCDRNGWPTVILIERARTVPDLLRQTTKMLKLWPWFDWLHATTWPEMVEALADDRS